MGWTYIAPTPHLRRKSLKSRTFRDIQASLALGVALPAQAHREYSKEIKLRTSWIWSLVLVGLLLGETASAQEAKPMDVKNGAVDGELAGKLDKRMLQLEAKGFSGVLFVMHENKVILAKGYGQADRERKVPFATETVFDIGSITKQFTGAAILKLEMQGKLTVSDPISKFFKDVPEDKKNIPLHELLTHSAGFVQSLGGDYDKVSREGFIKLAFASKLRSAPGKTYHYSNAGYSLLGAVIEQVTGGSCESYLHKNLFKPAGMLQTGYVIPKWKMEAHAVNYKKDKRWGTPLDHAWADDGPYWHLQANGGILSTVGDLHRWHLALEDDKVLSREAKAAFITPHIKETWPNSSQYGYGWVVEKTRRGTKLIQHNGGNGICFADFRRFVDEGAVLILATNAFAYSHMSELDRIERIVFPTAATK